MKLSTCLLACCVAMHAGCRTPEQQRDDAVDGLAGSRLPHGAPVEVAPPGAELAVEEAVWMVLQQNGDLQVATLEPIVAGAFLQRAQAAFDPELFAAIDYSEEKASETARSTGEQFDVSAEDRVSEAGLRRELSTGTDVELAVQERRDASNRAPEQQELRAALTLTQALLRGRRPSVNLVDVRQAELGIDVSDQELRGYVQALVADSETAYWEYALAVETIAITEQALEVAEQQLQAIRTRIEVGRLARNEEAAALAEVARRRQALIEARAAYNANRLDLLARIAPGVYTPEPRPTSPLRIPSPPLEDLEERLALAEVNRPDLLEARLRAEQGRLETVRTRDGLLPRLDFFAALANTGFGRDFGEAADTFPEDTYEWRVGLRFLYDLGARRAGADDIEAQVRFEQAALAVENLRRRIGTEVRQAFTEVERARQQIDASAETRRLQEQTLRAEQERFAVGSSTSLLVAQAQRDLLASQIIEQRVIVQYRIALIELEASEGTLLERRGIETHQAAPIAP